MTLTSENIKTNFENIIPLNLFILVILCSIYS